MNHGIALSDGVIQHIQRFAAGRDEILLYFDRNIGAFLVLTQGIAVTTKLSADSGEEKANLRHVDVLVTE